VWGLTPRRGEEPYSVVSPEKRVLSWARYKAKRGGFSPSIKSGGERVFPKGEGVFPFKKEFFAPQKFLFGGCKNGFLGTPPGRQKFFLRGGLLLTKFFKPVCFSLWEKVGKIFVFSPNRFSPVGFFGGENRFPPISGLNFFPKMG